ncbi:serine hydrolase [candidate division KSB1 bacterium]|nr:serine hydrolase [candidate division KSB1 bacterium]
MIHLPNFLRRAKRFVAPFLFLLFIYSGGARNNSPNISPRTDYVAVAADLERFITHEMRDKKLPALSIALVDDQDIVWAKGFGWEDSDKKTLATAETVYRVGSVSKLFTDIGIMQLVERGVIDLDAPVTNYLPDFKPNNPFAKTITLRQLMSHRSGLVREPPVGNYFDDTAPSLAQTVQSLNSTTLVYEPEKRIKYSNAAIATVGYVLEQSQKQPFTKYLQKAVLAPMGLRNSSFEPTPEITKHLAKAYMWSYDGRQFDAPTFQLGMAPAAGMYSTVTDLARFMSVLFNSGKGPNGQVLKPETLEKMWTLQFATAEEKNGFGLGFGIWDLQGYRRVGHDGAMYGFATELQALPEMKLGAVVVTSIDGANSITYRIAERALKLMLAVRNKQSLPPARVPDSVNAAVAHRLAGRYVRDQDHLDLVAREGKLLMSRRELLVELKSLNDTLIVDDRLAYGTKILPVDDGLRIGNDSFKRIPIVKPEPIPEHWQGLLGEYGWDHNVLFILEKDGKLHALIEWFFSYPLTEISKDVFAFPDYGLYHGEKLIFTHDQKGKATQVEAAGVVFKRRHLDGEDGQTFRITPLKPAEELRQMALAAQPPKENGEFLKSDLVDLATLDSAIKFDIRYATTNNFMSTIFYQQAKAFLQRPAAEALLRAQQNLKKQGYGLLIHDAYRPWYVTKMFWEGTPNDKHDFVANPANGSRHNRGCAVDLSLYDLKTGTPVQMVSGYDEFSERAYPNYQGGASLQRWHRELLRQAMEEQGFRVYEFEWWHFDYKDWRKYPIGNQKFEEMN